MQLKHTVVLMISIIALTIAGCVQPASQQVAMLEGDSATWTVTPSETPTPTVTLTPEAQIIEEVTPETIVEVVTATPSPTETPTPTDAISAFMAQSGPTEVAQDNTLPLDSVQQQQPVANEFELTATAIVAEATATQAFFLTQTAVGQGIGFPTFTPTFDAGFVDPFATPTPTMVTIIQPGQDCIHEVREADRSLYRLSLAYGVPIMDIARASGIVNPDLIRVGQRLTIPGCGTTGGIPPATSTPGVTAGLGTGGVGTGGGLVAVPPNGDCTWGTSVQFPNGCGAALGTSSTGTTDTAAFGTGGAGVAASRRHVVQQGETLFEISLQYGVTVAQIAQLNGISNYDVITFNQELLIP